MDNEHAERLTEAVHDLNKTLERLTMKIQDAIDGLVALSTAADGLSNHTDALVTATTALIAAFTTGAGNPDLTPEQVAAVTNAQTIAAAATTETAKVDAAVASTDAVLPTPAPAGPTPTP